MTALSVLLEPVIRRTPHFQNPAESRHANVPKFTSRATSENVPVGTAPNDPIDPSDRPDPNDRVAPSKQNDQSAQCVQ